MSETVSSGAGAAATPRERPLSPHLQIYRPQITSAMSIIHRATGIALSVGLLMLVCWVVAAASGFEAYDSVQSFLGSPLGIIMLMGWSWAMFYHLCNGIRHLVWDTGRGFAVPTVELSGKIALGVSTLLTIAVWIAAFSRFAE